MEISNHVQVPRLTSTHAAPAHGWMSAAVGYVQMVSVVINTVFRLCFGLQMHGEAGNVGVFCSYAYLWT